MGSTDNSESDDRYEFVSDTADFGTLSDSNLAEYDDADGDAGVEDYGMEVDTIVEGIMNKPLIPPVNSPVFDETEIETETENENENENEQRDVVNDDDSFNAIKLGDFDTRIETNEYQTELRVYVNRCVFIRTTNIGKRVGFAPSLPKTKTFYMCWTCEDWIPAGSSPICIPMCSNLHLTAKYVFERMFGLFCSWGCCKKHIQTGMNSCQRSKYMRSLHILRRLFCPEIAFKPIENVEARTEMTIYGGTITPEDYYSKIVKVNLRPLSEDICFWEGIPSDIASDPSPDAKKSESSNNRTGNEA